jgi:catechol 2,3-dioxygenase-like lactoylglutathione lyase family enzyme
MIKGLHHAGLSVANLNAAVNFYTTAHAFEEAWRFSIDNSVEAQRLLGVEDAQAEVALLRGPTGFLELFQFANPKRPTLPSVNRSEVFQAGLRHICLQAVDGHALYESFMQAGAHSHHPPSGLGTGNLYCYIRDPERNIIELEGVPYASSIKSEPWFAHVAIVTPDIVRLTDFYTLVTGNPVHSKGHFGPEAKFDVVAGLEGIVFDGAWIKAGGLTIEFWQYHTPKTDPVPPVDASTHGWSHFALEVEDLDFEYARLCALGVAFHTPPVSNGRARFVYARDPDGNIFELIEPRQSATQLSIDHLKGLTIPQELDALMKVHYRASRPVPPDQTA